MNRQFFLLTAAILVTTVLGATALAPAAPALPGNFVAIGSARDMADPRQVRIASVPPVAGDEAALSERAPLALLGAGMIVLGALRRRRAKVDQGG